MKRISLGSSLRDASNGGKLMSLALIDTELFTILCFLTLINNLLSIDSRDMYLPPFDASRYDESNELCFVSI